MLTIIIGVATTAVAFYFTSSMLLAQRQIIAASRLSAYLTYWQNWFLEEGLFGLYHEGIKWNKEVQEIRKRRGADVGKDLVQLQEEKKKIVTQVREALEKGGAEYGHEKIIQDLQRMPKESLSSVLEVLKTARQNLVDGKTFISDEGAATLGAAFAHTCIELKMGIIDVLDSGTMMLVTVGTPDNFHLKDFSTSFSQIIWKGILISKNIDLLTRAAHAISSKSVLALTLQNVRNGSRLTKR